MENNPTQYEKLFKRKTQGKHLAIMISLILGYIALANLFLFIAFLTAYHIGIVVFLAAILVSVIFFSFKFTRVEYEYSIYGGVFSFSKIYAKSFRRTVFDIEVSNLTDMLTYNEANLKPFTSQSFELISGISERDAKNLHFFVFKNGSDKNIIFLFEMDDKLRAVIKNYNPKLIFKSYTAK